MSSRSVPYAQATSGERARAEVAALLRRFGCESVGFMDDFADQSLMLAFQWHGRRVQLRASARGWVPCTCGRICGTAGGGAGKKSGSGAQSSKGWWPARACYAIGSRARSRRSSRACWRLTTCSCLTC